MEDVQALQDAIVMLTKSWRLMGSPADDDLRHALQLSPRRKLKPKTAKATKTAKAAGPTKTAKAPPKRPTERRNLEITKLVAESDLTYIEIADKFGLKRETVIGIARQLGVVRPGSNHNTWKNR
jgi:hypothetical protein